MNSTTKQLHWISLKELAGALDVNPGYVSAMIKQGFKPTFPPDYYTVEGALDWLATHSEFRTRDAYPSKCGKGRQRLAKGGKVKTRQTAKTPLR